MIAVRFSGSWPWWLILLTGIAGWFCIARWYWRESRHLPNPVRWLLPTLRGGAFFLILFMLAGPTLYHRSIQGELSRIRVLLDVSKSMSMVDDARDTRLNRSLHWLIGSDEEPRKVQGWLNELKAFHRVELVASNDTNHDTFLWDSQANDPLPKAESIAPKGANSPIGEFLSRTISQNGASKSGKDPMDSELAKRARADAFAAVVLISDGQSNAGMSISEAASRHVSKRVPVFTIGVGSSFEPADLGIVQVEHSQRVYRTDRLRGSIVVKERTKLGTTYQIDITHLGQNVFSKLLESIDQGQRRIEFDIPAEQLVDDSKKRLLSGSDLTLVPIDLQFSIKCNAAEVSLENNAFESSLWGVDRKNQVLILDRRGGWEMRYIKNAMERDPAWESTVSMGRTAFAQEFFPNSRAKLFGFDLILVTLETIREFSEEQQTWISDFIGVSGGGLIVIDSNRDRENLAVESVLSNLLPVRAIDSPKMATIQSMRLTPSARNQPAFQLGTTNLPNDQIWSQLRTPKSVRTFEIVPGAETMVELLGTMESKSLRPLVATKLFGPGRVIYFAADETWRWRYNVADLYHQRFWNQIATWAMRAPFAINDAFASLDSGMRIYSNSDLITVRAKLKQDDAQPLENASVQVILERDGERHSSIPLNQEPDAPGFYRTTFGPMPEGSYRVRLEVVGIPVDALTLQTQFVVQPPVDIEMQSLACNEESLRQAAMLTGGEFAFLDDASTISEKLKQYRTGKIVESQTLLWQSYPWFATIVGLLAFEWHLRKRSGLI